MSLEVRWQGGMPLPLTPGSPDAAPGLTALAPAEIAVPVPIRLTYDVPSQRFTFTYTHPNPIVRLVNGQAVAQLPVAWQPDAGLLALTVKLLLAGLAAGGDGDARPFFIVEDIVLRGAVGPALAIECGDPAVTLSDLHVDPQDARRIQGLLTVSPWSCTVTVPARLTIGRQDPPPSQPQP
ncbi:MAG TPA: hypothetical protein VK008_06275 [Sphingobacteriaceae bacterium]|nr:hypothetical protein [Sphingobacteriaceae bacterium]